MWGSNNNTNGKSLLIDCYLLEAFFLWNLRLSYNSKQLLKTSQTPISSLNSYENTEFIMSRLHEPKHLGSRNGEIKQS